MTMTEKKRKAPLLEVRNLKTYYPIRRGIFARTVNYVRAVDDVSFHLDTGETLGLVGESGCGKSTIGKTLVRLEQPTEGTIWFDGMNISDISMRKMKQVRPKMQMIFQDPYASLNPRMRIQEILEEPLLTHGIAAKADAGKEVDKLLDMVGLPKHYKHRYPHEFSGGQRQRIGIARAIALKPKLIICDEPVSALDVSIQAQILNLLSDLQKELKLTFLFIAHGLGAVKYISNRIAVMYLGKIVEVASNEQIFRAPRHPYTKALLSAYPVPNPHLRVKQRYLIQGDVPSPVNPPKGCRFHTRCPYAQAICREQEPLLKGGDHQVACFLDSP